MTFSTLTRRTFAVRLAGLVAAPSAIALLSPEALFAAGADPAQTPSDVSSDAESIHQVIVLDAAPARVYDTLLDPARFSAMTKFSTVPQAAPARIAREAGGAFSLFDGHIEGRHVELVPNRRIVQAWRAADWPAGLYSIARFELAAKGRQTELTFDHTGFLRGQGAHLAQGWYANYWTPMKKVLQ